LNELVAAHASTKLDGDNVCWDWEKSGEKRGEDYKEMYIKEVKQPN